MLAISSHALSGMQAAQHQMHRSAHAVAQAVLPNTAVTVEHEIVRQKEATYRFLSNARMLQTQDDLLGSLIDERA